MQISKKSADIESINFDVKLVQIRNVLNMCTCRQLFNKGKITVLRSQIFPIILYLASMLYTPEKVMAYIEKILFDFIWPREKHHVGKKVPIQGI